MTACRGCGERALAPIVSLGAMPPVNAFLEPGTEADERTFALDLFFCEGCSLVQLGSVVDPALLFETYTYVSSISRTNTARLVALADALVERLSLGPGSRILEIGSNDGTLLGRLRGTAPDVLGVDPARNVAALAERAGVPTLVEFFSACVARRLLRERGPCDLVLALNVVAHTPDLLGLLTGVATLLTRRGHFVVEVAHVLPTILSGAIDTIYHEHVFCFSLHALRAAAARAGLEVVDVETIAAQGGSLRVTLQRADGAGPASPRVAEVLAEETAAGVTRVATYARVARLAAQLRDGVRAGVERLARSHGAVVALGASARGVVLMNHCGLTAQDVAYAVDDTPFKRDKLMPGCHVPVAGWERIAADREAAFLLLSWNWREEILGKLRACAARSRVLVPLPALQELALG